MGKKRLAGILILGIAMVAAKSGPLPPAPRAGAMVAVERASVDPEPMCKVGPPIAAATAGIGILGLLRRRKS